MEGGDGKFAKVTVSASEAFLKACSQNVSGNKQELVARAVELVFFLWPCFIPVFVQLTAIL